MTSEQRINATTLLRFLENDAKDYQCDMGHWIFRGDKSPIPPPEERGKPGCGTAACLAGWAALLLAPVSDKVSEWDDQHRTMVLVPTEWAIKADIASSSVSTSTVSVPVSEVGKVVLGLEVASYFSEQDGPSQHGLSDHQWMIAVLRKELGLSYNEKIDTPRTDDDESSQWDQPDADDDE